MSKSLEFFSLDEGVKEKMRKGPEYQVQNGICRFEVLCESLLLLLIVLFDFSIHFYLHLNR